MNEEETPIVLPPVWGEKDLQLPPLGSEPTPIQDRFGLWDNLPERQLAKALHITRISMLRWRKQFIRGVDWESKMIESRCIWKGKEVVKLKKNVIWRASGIRKVIGAMCAKEQWHVGGKKRGRTRNIVVMGKALGIIFSERKPVELGTQVHRYKEQVAAERKAEQEAEAIRQNAITAAELMHEPTKTNTYQVRIAANGGLLEREGQMLTLTVQDRCHNSGLISATDHRGAVWLIRVKDNRNFRPLMEIKARHRDGAVCVYEGACPRYPGRW